MHPKLWVPMTLSLHVLSSPTLALMYPTTMSASCRGVILIFLKFITDLLLCIFWWCIIGNHSQFSKIRVRSSQDQYVADWFPVKQGFVHFSIHNHGYSSSVLVLCLSRIKNGLYRGRSLYQVYPACLTHARMFDVVTFHLPQYFLKPSCSIECSHIPRAHSYLCFRLEELHSRRVNSQLGLSDTFHSTVLYNIFC